MKIKVKNKIKEHIICDECLKCRWYWENQDDDYMTCDGESIPCYEYIEIKTK